MLNSNISCLIVTFGTKLMSPGQTKISKFKFLFVIEIFSAIFSAKKAFKNVHVALL